MPAVLEAAWGITWDGSGGLPLSPRQHNLITLEYSSEMAGAAANPDEQTISEEVYLLTPLQLDGFDDDRQLWLLPLVAAISVVYKTTKLPKIRFANFLKESVILFGSIVIFMAITALVLVTFAWLVTE